MPESESGQAVELGTIVATFNGTEVKSNLGTAGIIDLFPDEVGGEQLFISGLTALTAQEEALTLGFVIPRGELLETGNYNSSGECAGTNAICVGVGLVDPTNPDNDLAGGTSSGEAAINLLELDFQPGGIVRGTFSATYQSDNGANVTVTNGSFNVQIVI